MSDFPHAVLWDFDGSLVDTEPIWITSSQKVLARHGVEWTWEDGVRCSGTSMQTTRAQMEKAAATQGKELDVDPESLYAEVCSGVGEALSQDTIPWIPGAERLLSQLTSAGIPMGLVSSSPMSLLKAGVHSMPEGAFRVIVDGASVSRGKPDPEGYLKAAHDLRVDPRDCIVIEDSRPGSEAALASGACAILIQGMQEVPAHPRMVQVAELPDMEGLAEIWRSVKE